MNLLHMVRRAFALVMVSIGGIEYFGLKPIIFDSFKWIFNQMVIDEFGLMEEQRGMNFCKYATFLTTTVFSRFFFS